MVIQTGQISRIVRGQAGLVINKLSRDTRRRSQDVVMLVLHPKNSHSGRAGPVTNKLSRETLSSEKLYPGGSVLLVRSGRSGLWTMSDPVTGAKLDGGRG